MNKDEIDKAIEADVKNAFVLISEALTEDADSEAILLGKNELDYLGRQFDTITAEVELLREENEGAEYKIKWYEKVESEKTKQITALEHNVKLLISDSCDDDAAIRDLVRPFLGDKATDGDSYDTPDNVTLVEDIVHNVAVRDRALDAASEKVCFNIYGDAISHEFVRDMIDEFIAQAESEIGGKKDG